MRTLKQLSSSVWNAAVQRARDGTLSSRPEEESSRRGQETAEKMEGKEERRGEGSSERKGNQDGRRRHSQEVMVRVCKSRNVRPYSLATPFRTCDCERDHSPRPSIPHTHTHTLAAVNIMI